MLAGSSLSLLSDSRHSPAFCVRFVNRLSAFALCFIEANPVLLIKLSQEICLYALKSVSCDMLIHLTIPKFSPLLLEGDGHDDSAEAYAQGCGQARSATATKPLVQPGSSGPEWYQLDGFFSFCEIIYT